MSRFLILRRFQGGLQGTNRILRFVCDQGMCGAKEYNPLVRFHEVGYARSGGRPPPPPPPAEPVAGGSVAKGVING